MTAEIMGASAAIRARQFIWEIRAMMEAARLALEGFAALKTGESHAVGCSIHHHPLVHGHFPERIAVK